MNNMLDSLSSPIKEENIDCIFYGNLPFVKNKEVQGNLCEVVSAIVLNSLDLDNKYKIKYYVGISSTGEHVTFSENFNFDGSSFLSFDILLQQITNHIAYSQENNEVVLDSSFELFLARLDQSNDVEVYLEILSELIFSVDSENHSEFFTNILMMYDELRHALRPMLAFDALIQNTDRHNGNFGFLIKEEICFAPFYDLDKTLGNPNHPFSGDYSMIQMLVETSRYPWAPLNLNYAERNGTFLDCNTSTFSDCIQNLMDVKNSTQNQTLTSIIDYFMQNLERKGIAYGKS